MPDYLKVEGLAEVRRSLRRMEHVEELAELRDGLKEAARIVADDAKGRVPSRSGNAASSIRPTVSGNKAFVQGGKASVPYYGWLDFGSRNPVRGNPRSAGPWSGSGTGPKDGRFIYPAIDAKSAEVAEAVAKGLDRVLKSEGFT